MTTPGPCGCQIRGEYGSKRYIIYCPTHAVAFENAERAKELEAELEDALRWPDTARRKHSDSLIEAQNADLLAALINAVGYIVDNDLPVPVQYSAAIARAEGES